MKRRDGDAEMAANYGSLVRGPDLKDGVLVGAVNCFQDISDLTGM